MKRTIITFFLMLAAVTLSTAAKQPKRWVATWATAVQKVEPHNLPPAPYLAGNTLRQIVEVSVAGNVVRLELSNQYNTTPTEIMSVELAEAVTEGESADIVERTTTALTFDGKPSVTMQPGQTITSDPVKFRLRQRMPVAITIRFGQCSQTDVSGHPGSRTTSYIISGHGNDFSSATRSDHWCYISNLQVEAKGKMGSIAVIGNSITDGRGTTTNHQNRWTDNLSRRLLANKATRHLSVLNYGLGGNCVLRGGLGPTANSRFERDALSAPGVKYVIVFEGVNDLGGAWQPDETANQLIDSFKAMIEKAHAHGLKIYGATIMPFRGNNYYNPGREAARQKVNEWIRNSGEYDGLIDFDRAMSDPQQSDRLNPAFLFENDWLHPNADGYQTMGNCIDLNLFK